VDYSEAAGAEARQLWQRLVGRYNEVTLLTSNPSVGDSAAALLAIIEHSADCVDAREGPGSPAWDGLAEQYESMRPAFLEAAKKELGITVLMMEART
jgi:hypothetical protein